MSPFAILAIVLLVSSSVSDIAFAQSLKPLESINYWESTFDIVQFSNVADQLDITPSQRKLIMEMRSRKDLGDLITETRFSLRLKNALRTKHSEYYAVDDRIKTELAKILEPPQLAALKTIMLRNRFKTCCLAFQDPEVITSCDLTKDEFAKLIGKCKSVEQLLKLEVQSDAETRMRTVAQSIPSSSQNQFAQYVGNSCLPQIRLNMELDYHDLPFRKYGLSTLYFIKETANSSVDFPPDKMDAVRNEFTRLSAIQYDRRIHGEINDYLRTLDAKGVEFIEKSLTKEQLLQVGRAYAHEEFRQNFRAPFDKNEVNVFLGLSNDDVIAIRKKATLEQALHAAKVNQLNNRYFLQICEELPFHTKGYIISLFAGVWPIE
jgi:hypothetical protein